MPRAATKFICQQCGFESVKYMGRCPDCGEWNSLVETVTQPAKSATGKSSLARAGMATPTPLSQVATIRDARRPTGSHELDRVLGGGLVPGSLVLFGGEPGVGKSTLLAGVAGHIALNEGEVLYVSAEESAQQVKLRAERLGIETDRLLLLAETDVDAVVTAIEQVAPKLVVVDSIQTVASDQIGSAPGSVSQVRESTLRLMHVAKRLHIPICIIGHVTKEGTVAGPRTLEHMVDAVLYLEGERFHIYRLLRGAKNRFGPTDEVGVFEMSGDGMLDVADPSGIFLTERRGRDSGSAVVVSMEGTRPLLVEAQALATTTAFGAPRITTNGVDRNRLLMLLAVLTKRVGLALANQDVYVNVAGGFTLDEPAVDLGVAVAVASSFTERRVTPNTVLLGEIGLGGELRPVTRTLARVREAEKLGFERCILPAGGHGLEGEPGAERSKIELRRVSTVREAIEIALEQ